MKVDITLTGCLDNDLTSVLVLVCFDEPVTESKVPFHYIMNVHGLAPYATVSLNNTCYSYLAGYFQPNYTMAFVDAAVKSTQVILQTVGYVLGSYTLNITNLVVDRTLVKGAIVESIISPTLPPLEGEFQSLNFSHGTFLHEFLSRFDAYVNKPQLFDFPPEASAQERLDNKISN